MSRLSKKLIFSIIFTLVCSRIIAQHDSNVFHETKGSGFVLFASNKAHCPVSIILELTLENLAFSKAGEKIFVVPANTAKFKLGELTVIKKSQTARYKSKFKSNYGNFLQTVYEREHEYWLPYAKGSRFRVIQGYNGLFSHLHENSLDFSMPEGTEITAAREGTVIKVVQHHMESCLRPECKQLANFILIYHNDNTMAEYSHLQFNGAKVKIGDKVKKGDVIALSGNTGYSNAAHLHFTCYSMIDFKDSPSIKTKFRTGNNLQLEFLKENIEYLKEY